MALRSETPGYAVLEDRREAAAADPVSEVRILWSTNHIPQRSFAIALARDVCMKKSSYVSSLRPLLWEALNDADSEVRHIAAVALRQSSVRADGERLLPLLSDADPFVRGTALEFLRLMGDASFTRAVTPSLYDPDPAVVMQAIGWLSKWHGVDFGARGNQSAADNSAAFDRCRKWVELHIDEFPVAPALSSVTRPCPVRAPSISSPTLDGRRFESSTMDGRTVVLHFWHTHLRKTQVQLGDLAELERRFAGRAMVVNVPVDIAPIEHEHKHTHGESDDHGHEEEKHAEVEFDDEVQVPAHSYAEARKDVEDFCREKRVTGIVLLDTAGTTAIAFGANDLPSTVIIGGDGFVSRRFSGARSKTALEAMIEEAMGKGGGVGK
jgi:hypothetical protein